MCFKTRLILEEMIDANWQIDVEKIHSSTNKIGGYIIWRLHNRFSGKQWKLLCSEIASVISIWSGHTYIGVDKNKNASLKNAFQKFFVQIQILIRTIDDNSWKNNRKERTFADYAKYTGEIYRYIGSNYYDNKSIVYPIYNDYYVSWSKNKYSSYIESKLYGPMTWIAGWVEDDVYALDMEGIQKYCNEYYRGYYNISRSNEREVVFPTYEKNVKTIKVIDYDEEDNRIETILD